MSSSAAARRSLTPVKEDRRVRERAQQVIVSGPAMNAAGDVVDVHTHCIMFDGETGNGKTSPGGPDGHIHVVRELNVVPVRGHDHDLSAQRCERPHSPETGGHVQARR